MRVSNPIAKIAALVFFASAGFALAGAPFVTDDPIPVELGHWEIFLGTQDAHSFGGWRGTAPQAELNYGAAPELQLHLLAQMALSAPSGEGRKFGCGDTELGAKFRFVKEAGWIPSVAVFPTMEAPTGSHARGLGSGHADFFAPMWLQKTFGKCATYGGGGYWINPGAGNKNWWFAGWQAQYQITANFALGAEIFHETSQRDGAGSDTKLNGGAIWDIDDTFHVTVSAGHTIQGPPSFVGYAAIQVTLGPEKRGQKATLAK